MITTFFGIVGGLICFGIGGHILWSLRGWPSVQQGDPSAMPTSRRRAYVREAIFGILFLSIAMTGFANAAISLMPAHELDIETIQGWSWLAMIVLILVRWRVWKIYRYRDKDDKS